MSVHRRPHLTPAQIAAVEQLLLSRLSGSAIARKLDIGIDQVRTVRHRIFGVYRSAPIGHTTNQHTESWAGREKKSCPPPPVYDSGFVKAPSKAQLMSGRASPSRTIVSDDES